MWLHHPLAQDSQPSDVTKATKRQTETLKEQILPNQQELGFGEVQNITILPRMQHKQAGRQQTDGLPTSEAHVWTKVLVLSGSLRLQKLWCFLTTQPFSFDCPG